MTERAPLKGLVLAGGQSRRMGSDKAALELQGSTLLDRAVNLLRSQLGDALDRLAKVEGAAGEVHISSELTRLFNITDKLAQQRNDQYISSELFVLAALDGKSPLKGLLEQAGGLLLTPDAKTLERVIAGLLSDTEERKKVGQQAYAVVAQNRGALQRLVAVIQDLLPPATID